MNIIAWGTSSPANMWNEDIRQISSQVYAYSLGVPAHAKFQKTN